MKSIFFSVILLVTVYKSALEKPHSVQTRGIIELAGAIKCSTGLSALEYMAYGCYCGLGGKGWPRDKADWCCHKHDCCYEEAELAGCNSKMEKYEWACKEKMVDCGPLTDRCQRMLCKCDNEVASCLSKALYNSKYRMWPHFLCGTIYPTCNYY
ncbi:group 10 secretory phospholipase A2 [Latimeria chalumnae]|uniref:group 10 secretory phospholipase A2 n=1 Tax=Latimeria chalumnae TaxID=7897 RepID=UPI0003C0FB8A|nr:PREDICTED: group 10 secretory phospholipase A2 [Latimeria chalumnae]|eukprot:XP_006009663.1 PREDICTED: group 10 secretory phospholipase A2 [Latimeria chalumnae]